MAHSMHRQMIQQLPPLGHVWFRLAVQLSLPLHLLLRVLETEAHPPLPPPVKIRIRELLVVELLLEHFLIVASCVGQLLIKYC